MFNKLNCFIDWCNDNSGFLSFLIFLMSIWIGWMIKKMNQPKLKVKVIPKMSFYSLFVNTDNSGNMSYGILCLSLNISITNRGNRPTSIEKIELGYKLDNKLFERKWLKQTYIFDDFTFKFENRGIVFPLLTFRKVGEQQKDEYLEIGKSINGIAYFEQKLDFHSVLPSKAYSGLFPLTLRIKDIYSKTTRLNVKLNHIDISEARIINPYFGKTYDEMNLKGNSE